MEPQVVTVAEARDAYLAANGYDTSSYSDDRFVVRLGFLPLAFRNPGVLHWHDLHHVASGFSSGLVGEAEVSAYELRIAGRPPLVTLLCLSSILLCLLVAPRRLWSAWRRSKGCVGLYRGSENYESVLALPLVELRRRLNIPAGGLAANP
jgi:hypothetical protein